MSRERHTITSIMTVAHENSQAHGFWDDAPHEALDQSVRTYLGNKLMLVVGEVAEAHEELRKKHPIGQAYGTQVTTFDAPTQKVLTVTKPEGLPSELADIVIRVLDLVAYLEIDLEEAIVEKMAFNATRPLMHGKRF